jgi:hypothetical protein
MIKKFWPEGGKRGMERITQWGSVIYFFSHYHSRKDGLDIIP